MHLRIEPQPRTANRDPEQLFRFFHCISWGLPAVFCMVVLWSGHAGKNSYSVAPDWCWIRSTDDNKDPYKDAFIWQFVGGKAVEWFSFFIWCPTLYILCWRHLSKQVLF